MGISGLLTLLKSIQRPCNLRKFNGLTLGVDAYVWLHRGTAACAIDLALDKPTSRFVEFAMNRVRMLIHFGITPYLVFDGDYLPSKGITEESRAKRREESKAFGLQLHRAGKMSQAQAELQKAVDVTPEMAGQLMEELRRHNIKFVVAPYEADAQLAYLERKGIIQGIISEDSDLLVFGAHRLITKLDQYGDCVEINRDHFTACKSVSLVGWTDVEFRRMAILSGCDYLPNVARLGLKTAYSLVRKFHTPERIIQRLRFDARYTVPADYLENFRKAELTFLHQWVFCPEAQKLVMGTPLIKSELDNLDFLGKDVEPTIARGIASGRLHPTTKKPLVVDSVPLRNSQSPWGTGRTSMLATPNGKVGKPIDQYFKERRVPLAELDPNTFTPSPSQVQLQQNANRSWLSSPVPNSPLLPLSLPRSSTARRPGGQNGSSLRSGYLSLKRPRLCNEDDDDTEGASTASAHSRFFSSATRPSLRQSKSSRQQAKNEPINIWSDDSIDDALANLPDLSTLEADRVAVHRDSVCKPAKTPALLEAPSIAKQSSLGHETSFAESASTQATSTSLLESMEPTPGETKDNLSTSPSCEIQREVPQTPKALDLSHFVAKDAESVFRIPDSPLEAARPSVVGALSSRASVPVSSTALSAVIGGSEDLLVPQSDEESDTAGQASNALEGATPRLDLSRFVFSG